MPTRLLVAIVCVLLLPLATLASDPEEVTLVLHGRNPLPIGVSESASQEVRESAETLATYLGQISGVKFSVVVGDKTSGIRVGRLSDFPERNLGISPSWAKDDPTVSR